MIRVSHVHTGSIASQLGMLPGTELLSVNGRDLEDFLDWEFLTAEDELAIEARLPSGQLVVYEVERPEGEPMGVVLEPPPVRRCANKCEFCFIEGLPKGLRRSLYIRDDDYRLSFAYGNFATLSNLREKDVRRIMEYRLSPLYVSVHATDWEVRRKLLNNARVANVLEQLRTLAEGGIQFHCQMVVVPNVNDGEVLERSLIDLWELAEAVQSAAVVPVGLTQFSHLYTGRTMDQEAAASLVDVVERWGRRGLDERGTAWVFGSDELYLLAGRPLPGPEYYGDYPQIENGIGAVTALRDRIRGAAGALPRLEGLRIGVVTGTSMAASVMPELLGVLHDRTGAHLELLAAESSLFGPSITVAGLLVGADVARVLGGRQDLDFALIPAESINEDRLFLDDASLADVRNALPMPIFPSYDFIDVLTSAEPHGVRSRHVEPFAP